MLPQSHIAPDRDELREPERVDESVHQPSEQRGQGNVTGTDPIAVERIAIAVVSAMRNTDRDFSIERATKLGAKVFTGTVDPAVAQAWMTNIERVFDVMGCLDERMLCLATFLLEEGAYDWWQSSYKDAKQKEFLKLVQGQMTVAEYQVRFIELSKYAQVLVSNEIDKCRRFENGSREEIRLVVTAAGWNGSSQRLSTPRQGESFTSTRLPYCQLCRRPHLSTCLKFKGSGVYYHCDQGGHIRRNCPVLSQESGMVPKIFPQQSAGSTRQNQTRRDD
ncbi:uncharacterized protein LOC111369990 [Olea europaea var. sylvestris]|uniref:uncharacterized protein LOC111369990 n=1 Tax=Olea europaea var. sylvestris TaxID=158386 RepID=UPI000C1CDDA3|nr:uncharacterized protein LOC111369990 [Olea europaea var. sylvestris]